MVRVLKSVVGRPIEQLRTEGLGPAARFLRSAGRPLLLLGVLLVACGLVGPRVARPACGWTSITASPGAASGNGRLAGNDADRSGCGELAAGTSPQGLKP